MREAFLPHSLEWPSQKAGALHVSGAPGPPSVKWGVETESYTCLSPAQISPDPMALRLRLSFDAQSSHTVPWPCREARLSREPGSLTNLAQPGPRASAARPGSSSSFLTFSSAGPQAHRARVSSLCGTLADVPTPHLTLPKEWLAATSLASWAWLLLQGEEERAGLGGQVPAFRQKQSILSIRSSVIP